VEDNLTWPLEVLHQLLQKRRKKLSKHVELGHRSADGRRGEGAMAGDCRVCAGRCRVRAGHGPTGRPELCIGSPSL
jgi:hypothetical protein